MDDISKRLAALDIAVRAGATAKDLIAVSTAALAFLDTGNDSKPTAKPAKTGAKADKVSAPDTDTGATEQSSDKPAEPKADATKTTSPSDKGDGFDSEGNVVTKQDVVVAAQKFVAADDNGEPELLAVFEEFGAAKLSDIDPAQYAEVIARLATPSGGPFD
jgi:hypothetical protein